MTVEQQNRGVLVMGGGIAGMQAALDLADAGFNVFLVERRPAIGGRMVQLDKTFPTNDCSMCTISPRLVHIGLHQNIKILTNTSVEKVNGEYPNFVARLKYHPRYIDIEKCKACGECTAVCPVSLPNDFDTGLSTKKAIFKQYPQATPNAFAIQKKGWAPCKSACPAHVNTQGYVALIRQRKFKEALALIRRDLPLPSVCGRACARPCETACAAGHPEDGAVAIRALKRFVADLQKNFDNIDIPEPIPNPCPKQVAVVGSGPAGLSAAYFLALKGHRVTIFEARAKPGGMLRFGVPAYRLPREIVDAEIQAILAMGVILKTETALGRDFTAQALLESGHDAVFVATGLHRGRKLGIPGENLSGVFQGVDFLRSIEANQTPVLGDRVVVIGGGNVAVDVARSAIRLGSKHVTMVCLEAREEMPAHEDEITEALEEGIVIDNGYGPMRIDTTSNGLEITLKKCTRCFEDDGTFHPVYDESRTQCLIADAVVLAVGQVGDPTLMTACGLDSATLSVDPITLETPVPGVFAGGDLVSGPKTIVEAVAMGRRAAEAIHATLTGRPFDPDWPHPLPRVDAPHRAGPPTARHEESRRPSESRTMNFEEITAPLSPEDAVAEAHRCLSCADCSECRQCETVCESGAINHMDREATYNLQVGAVILAPGFDEFDVGRLGEYGFGRYKNVLTSLSLERMLSASGPTGGHIKRPSDDKPPTRIAWIQCAGSRDVRRNRHYCSAVCCMFATKQSLIIKDHFPEMDATIFYMDMRAYGKGFDAYVERAKTRFGVRYERAMVSKIYALPETNDLEITFRSEAGTVETEVFNLVVLSSGLTPSKTVSEVAAATGVALDAFGFAQRTLSKPNQTNRKGIYVAGVIEGPKDIPETVMSAASAAALAAADLADTRGVGLTRKIYPEERIVEGESPRVGVFVCRCGVNIARVVDVPTLTEYVRTVDGVVFAEENLYTCSADIQTHIAEMITEHRLNRVVVASCTPRTHEPLFQETLRNAGLNKYLFEMANIRDQCAWVHADDPPAANEKAKDLVRMAIGRAKALAPLEERRIPVVPTALVLGGGMAGMSAARSIADQGFSVTLVEKEPVLGGNLRHITALENREDPMEIQQTLIHRITGDPAVTVLTDAVLTEMRGHIGNFTSEVLSKGTRHTIRHGVVIVTTGASPYTPATGEFAYGTDPNVITQTDLEGLLLCGRLREKRIAMIQCVGSRTGEPPVCSRVCCTQAIKNALRIKTSAPDASVTIFYRDIRTYGLRESLYREAREKGVLFVRYDADTPPRVTAGTPLTVTSRDPGLDMDLRVQADLLVLSAGIRPREDAAVLAGRLKVPLGEDGFFSEAHMKLRPLDFASDGIYLAGLAHGPKLLDESIAQAQGAAARAATILSKATLPLSPEISSVDPTRCVGCLTCVRSCPFGVPKIGDDKTAFIEPAACQGCGICASACPRKAITTHHSTDAQISAKVDALFDEEGRLG